MPRKVKLVNINEDSSYGDVAEAIVENEKAETQAPEEAETQEVEPPKPKARAKRVPKPKAVVDDTAVEPEPAPEQVAAPKPRAVKDELHVQQPNNQVPPFPPRLSRTAAREALYHSLASGGLS